MVVLSHWLLQSSQQASLWCKDVQQRLPHSLLKLQQESPCGLSGSHAILHKALVRRNIFSVLFLVLEIERENWCFWVQSIYWMWAEVEIWSTDVSTALGTLGLMISSGLLWGHTQAQLWRNLPKIPLLSLLGLVCGLQTSNLRFISRTSWRSLARSCSSTIG